MPRRSWKRHEEEFLIENYAIMTTEELSQALSGRSKKSINRKIEKLREEGKIGHRTKETISRAYHQRNRGKKLGGNTSNTSRRNKRGRGRLPVDNYEYEDI